ncbi:DUF2846 domain-containing protein [Ectopseudomonas mendocina]|uniref:DUF2846 domain-containing protein n=1 Tax=Ectopseudomonas mendocina TaxID=300 RepID=A0ABZ2RD63_ECTME
MLNTLKLSAASLAFLFLAGCASVPMESADKDQQLKAFPSPANNQAGLYIFRDSSLGPALKKSLYIDDQLIGETATKTYFYRLITPGQHTLSTESEFGNNNLILDAQAGKNHYVRQSIKVGVFVGGAKLEEVSESEGQKGVMESKLAR